ncbi:G patch domain-containing protein 11, variant 2 [Entomophthora muscae]|uniref:G patch domain-containing protein 11, variant 2 n=1 Tax=Entomophthora muscae TaxID=34485 RepID=A0ACC2RWQ2_9FUNG|nr:G patch domain-containing protein 11, variant 2 [Entomophthora muscae]
MSLKSNPSSTEEKNKRKIEEDEDDYLSMDLEVLEKEYINQVKEKKKNERDPYHIKRIKDLEDQKKRGYNKSAKLIAEENEKAAADTPISSSNKGFQLLQKMGFKPGTGLGLGQGGIKEPINLSKNAGSQGLGLEAEKREKSRMMLEAMKKIEQKKQVCFKDTSRQRFREKQIQKDLYNSRVVCEQLDLSKVFLLIPPNPKSGD